MGQPINPYDLRLLRNQQAIAREILKHYQSGIQTLVPVLSSVKYKGKTFYLRDYPALQKKVDVIIKKISNQVQVTIVNGIKENWDLSNKKNDILVDKRIAGKRAKKKALQALYDPNAGALDSFLSRKEKGLGLSQRVWNGVKPFKSQIEQVVGIGIGKGESATDIAKSLKQYLNEPEKLFRRVKGKDGELHLSTAARNYHPGQGVYRSAYKNSMRLVRSETNMAYRTADHERWKKLPFVTGIRVRLSSAHPKYDICDQLTGVYPKDFKFPGWHPQCICFATPEQMSDEEYSRLEDQILAGEPISTSSASNTTTPPAAFGKYLEKNKEMLSRLKNEPYWMRDNKKYLPGE